jgi:polysaccharide chain length determinant protein (PEP-CTERM system associated)
MASATGGKDLTIKSMLDLARRRVLLIAVVTVVVTGAAAAYAYHRPVLFRALALIGVESNTRDVVQKTEGTGRVQDQLLAIRESMFSRPVLEPVMEKFHLYAKQGATFSDQEVEKMRGDLKITVETDDTFHLSYEGQDRQRVMDVTNAVAEGFVGQLAQDRQQQQSNAATLLDSELAKLRATLDQQQEQVEHYKQRAVNELPDRLDTNLRLLATTEAEVQTISASRADDQAKLSAVAVEMAELEKQGVLTQQAPKEKTAAEIKLDDLRMHLKQLRAEYTDQYPELISTEREIKDLEKVIAATPAKPQIAEPSAARMRYLQLKAEKESLQQRLTSYTQQQDAIQSRADTMQQRVQATPTHESAISELSLGYEATKTRYNALLAKQQEMRLASGLERVNRSMSFKVVEPASLPAGPSTPQRGRVLMMGLLAGLVMGFIAAFGLEQMNSTIGTIGEFQTYTDLPVLAALPNLDLKASGRPMKESSIALVPVADGPATLLSAVSLRANRIVALTDPESVAAEQYRLLGMKVRRRLQQSQSPGAMAAPTLMVTGFVGGEGKTVTALNLSLSLAGTIPGRVLLIDSDLRKPRVSEYLGMPSSKGFSDLLRFPDDDTGNYLWKLKDLYIMPGGSSLANPVALLSSKNASAVLQRLRAEFDFVVIDTPPVLPVADSHILAGLVDGVIIVVRARYTRREAIALGLENFQASNLLGAVINDVDLNASGYASAHQYYNQNYAGTA